MNLKEQLRQRLQETMPGDKIRYKMAPMFRLPKDYKAPDPTTARIAGVLAMLYPWKTQWYIAFMQRPEDGFAHGGQISFPGGRKEEEDVDVIETALRETEEEFGVDRSLVEVLGQLSELYIPVSNSLVYPTVGMLTERPVFTPSPREVEEIIEVPLSLFLQEDVVKKKLIKTSSGFQVDAAYYDLEGRVLWGATAMMMSELVAVLSDTDFR